MSAYNRFRSSSRFAMRTFIFLMFIASQLPAASQSKCWKNVVPGLPTGKGKRVGGLWIQQDCTKPTPPPSPKLIEQLARQRMANRGSEAIGIGVAIAMTGFCLSLFFANRLVRKAGDWVFMAGVPTTIYGFFMMGIARHFVAVSVCIVVFVIGFISIRIFKNHGIGKGIENVRR